MHHNLTTGILTPETEALLTEVLAEKVQNNESFFAIDVSNEVKTRGIKATTPTGFGRHSDMQTFIFGNMMQFMSAGLYGCTDFPYNPSLGLPPRRLYHPLDTPQATVYAHENRRVIPLPPVEVLMAQKSQQATGTQTSPVSFADAKALAHDMAGVGGTVAGLDAAKDATQDNGAAPPDTLAGHILKQLGNGQ